MLLWSSLPLRFRFKTAVWSWVECFKNIKQVSYSKVDPPFWHVPGSRILESNLTFGGPDWIVDVLTRLLHTTVIQAKHKEEIHARLFFFDRKSLCSIFKTSSAVKGDIDFSHRKKTTINHRSSYGNKSSQNVDKRRDAGAVLLLIVFFLSFYFMIINGLFLKLAQYTVTKQTF